LTISRKRILKDGNIRFQGEIRLRGYKTLTATFGRKTDAKRWIQRIESDIRAGRHQIYSESKRHTFKEAAVIPAKNFSQSQSELKL